MSTLSDLTRRIESERRQLLSMRQNQQALASGDLTEADIEAMAIERVRTGRTSGRRPQQREPSPAEPRLELLGWYYRDHGEPLLEDPWWISIYSDREPGVDEPDLPIRRYQAHILRHAGRRYLCLALEWEPA